MDSPTKNQTIIHCLDCEGKHLIFPESPQYFDLVICEDCGAEFTYGNLRNRANTEEMEALPVCTVQELE